MIQIPGDLLIINNDKETLLLKNIPIFKVLTGLNNYIVPGFKEDNNFIGASLENDDDPESYWLKFKLKSNTLSITEYKIANQSVDVDFLSFCEDIEIYYHYFFELILSLIPELKDYKRLIEFKKLMKLN
jgi:hypothetical protein